jgi:hypothetical protein
MDECQACRDEAADLIAIMQRGNRRKVRKFAVPLAAAAAVIGVLLVGPSLSDRTDESGERLRDPETALREEGTLEVRSVTPMSQAVVEPGSLEFAWETVEEGAFYRLTVTDETGEPLWSLETVETSATLPSEVELRSGRVYFWFVDVLLEDGRTGTTGVLSFELSG